MTDELKLDKELTIEECESLAYKIWYLKFEDRCKSMLEEHTKKIQSEFTLLRKYKEDIYSQYSILQTMMKECKNIAEKSKMEFNNIYEIKREIKKLHTEIKDIERKLSYALGHPYNKRLLEKEYLSKDKQDGL